MPRRPKRNALPDPNRAECIALPPELLCHVLKSAQEGDSAFEQVRTRLRFERVCKGWFVCDVNHRWEVVAVDGIDRTERLLDRVNELRQLVELGAWRGRGAIENVALRIKSIGLNLPKEINKRRERAVADLLDAAKNVESVEIATDECVFDTEVTFVGEFVHAALVKLAKLKRFALSASEGALGVSPNHLRELFSQWPKLESFTLENCYVDYVTSLDGIFAPLNHLETLVIRNVYEEEYSEQSLVREMPPTTRTLHFQSDFDSCEWPDCPSPLSASEKLLETARELVDVTLINRSRPRLREPERGQHDHFIANLNNVTRLTLTPDATSDFSSLAKLNNLATLEIPVEFLSPWLAIKPSELIALFSDSTSLKHVTLSSELRKHWNSDQTRLVQTAAGHGINLTWMK